MDYISLIENTLQYIEENLEEELTLETLSQRCYLSKYYFHRIFTAVLGCSLNEYINQRRLNKALDYIIETSQSMTDIAYNLKFGSQAAFNRAFKEHFCVSPSQVRKELTDLKPTPVPTVLKRAMKNFNSQVVSDFTFVEQEQLDLVGFFMNVDLANPDIQSIVNEQAAAFLQSAKPQGQYSAFAVYFKRTAETESSSIRVFFGIDSKSVGQTLHWSTLQLPAILSAKFSYKGDLLHIGDTVVQDLRRWMQVAKIEMDETEIYFVQAYDQQYQDTGLSNLYLPIREIPQEM